MSTNFPTSLDALTNPTVTSYLDDAGVSHFAQHANANDALEAIQARVGVTNSAVTTSHDYKIRQRSRLPDYLVASAYATDRMKNAADIVCDGTADQADIQTALDALPTNGGWVQLSAGTFNLSAPINISKMCTRFEGLGKSTLDRHGDATVEGVGTSLVPASGFAGTEIIKVLQGVKTVYGMQLRHFNIAGNGVAGPINGIDLACHNSIIEHLHIHQLSGHGMLLNGTATWGAQDNFFNFIFIMDCTLDGFVSQTNSSDNHMVHCWFTDHNRTALRLSSSSWQITGSHFSSSDEDNVVIEAGGTKSKFVNCKIENSGFHNVHIDTTVSGMGALKFIGCNFKSAGWQAHNTYDDFMVDGSTSNGCSGLVIVGCDFSWQTTADNGGTIKERYHLNLSGNMVQSAVVVGNSFGGAVTGHINHATASSLKSIVRDNAGYVTENSGTATVASGTTSIAVTHGLNQTPAAKDIIVTPTNNMGSATKFWVSAVGATTFTINTDVNPGATTATFAWQAIIQFK